MRSELIIPLNTNLVFVYDSIDYSDYNNYYLRLYTVHQDGRKILINIEDDNIFFDIKLNNSITINSYIEEFNPQSYKEIERQPFNSTERYDFLHLYFKNHNK